MDEALRGVLASLGTTGILLGIIWLWLQKYIDKKLDALIAAQTIRMKGEAETLVAFRKQRLEKTVELIPKLQQIASECRHNLRLLKNRFESPLLQEFVEKREQFVDLLYGMQLLLLPASYEAVHGFKATLDKCYLAFENPGTDPPRAPKNLSRLITEVDERYAPLVSSLRAEFERVETQLGGKPS